MAKSALLFKIQLLYTHAEIRFLLIHFIKKICF